MFRNFDGPPCNEGGIPPFLIALAIALAAVSFGL
jgi:hypothetical protein